MKTISLLLLAVLSLTTTACAVDEDPRSGTPGRPASKPSLGDVVVIDLGMTGIETDIDKVDQGSDMPTLDPSDPSLLDGMLGGHRGDWAEEIVLNDIPRTVIHHFDGRRELLDETP